MKGTFKKNIALRTAIGKTKLLLIAGTLSWLLLAQQASEDCLGQLTKPAEEVPSLSPAPAAKYPRVTAIATPEPRQIRGGEMPAEVFTVFVAAFFIPWTVMMGLVAIRKGKRLVQGLLFGGLPLLSLVAFSMAWGTVMFPVLGLASFACLIIGFLGSCRLLSLTDDKVRKQIDDIYAQLGTLRSQKP